jgi:small subunit ribosomal protein S27e
MTEKVHSKFLKVKCNDCDSEQIIFNKTNMKINCPVCGTTLAVPKGGSADIKATVVGALSNAQEK